MAHINKVNKRDCSLIQSGTGTCPQQRHVMLIHGLLSASSQDHLWAWPAACSEGGMAVYY